ncbi:MAG: protein kinase [candidate division Zixibacteria bacterium]|nr:protein kinase [candidate division Zixibacteria bacterium]
MADAIDSRYKILEKLGEGGVGEVYLAEDTVLGRKVALKKLSSGRISDPDSRRRFIQEAKAQALLNHPNIATFFEVGETPEEVFIVMEYVEGRLLSQLVTDGKLSLSDVLDLAIQIGEGLLAAHEVGIVHRDIKPANVLVTSRGSVKLTDFGLAKWSEAGGLTQTGVRVGTAHYMSPEQVEGKNVDHRSDIFSFGAVLYELLTSKKPFDGESETAIFYEVLNVTPQPLARYARGIPPELERVVQKCLAKDSELRYQRMDDLLADLRMLKKNVKAGRLGGEVSEGVLVPSIAVLPFTNLSPEPENEYFSDGLTDEIITNLTKIRTLKVISRTSAMRYKKTAKSLRQIAAELSVQYILEGSVRKYGDHLRITAQLVDAFQDAHLWAETFRGTVEDLFDIQEKVAEEIASHLRLHLTPGENRELKKRYTENTEAYQLYLQGRFQWNKRTVEGFNKAIELFSKALQIDPRFAPAYAGLADSYALLGETSLYARHPHDVYPKAREAAARALELDDRLAEAHTSMGYLKMNDYDWTGAEEEFKKAIELNPNYATTYHWYSSLLSATGRNEEALVTMEKARNLDPISLPIQTDMGLAYYFARQYDRAIEQYKRALDLDPNFTRAYISLSSALALSGRYEEALAEVQKAIERTGDRSRAAYLGRVYARMGERKKALEAIEEVKEIAKGRLVSPHSIALVYAALGEKDLAFEWLNKSWEEGYVELYTLKVDPWLDSLRDDPRFQELLDRARLKARLKK